MRTAGKRVDQVVEMKVGWRVVRRADMTVDQKVELKVESKVAQMASL